MSKKEKLNYQAVVNAINELRAGGQAPSVRLIRSKVGGSNSTLLEYLRRWQEESMLASKVDADVSEVFQQALKAEFGRVTSSVRETYEALLSEEKRHTAECQELLVETEARVADLESQLRENKDECAKAILKLERSLAAAVERSAELQRQSEKSLEKADNQTESLRKQISTIQEEKHKSQVQVAILETKLVALEKSGQQK
jgi:chromosome segregation ATPase